MRIKNQPLIQFLQFKEWLQRTMEIRRKNWLLMKLMKSPLQLRCQCISFFFFFLLIILDLCKKTILSLRRAAATGGSDGGDKGKAVEPPQIPSSKRPPILRTRNLVIKMNSGAPVLQLEDLPNDGNEAQD